MKLTQEHLEWPRTPNPFSIRPDIPKRQKPGAVVRNQLRKTSPALTEELEANWTNYQNQQDPDRNLNNEPLIRQSQKWESLNLDDQHEIVTCQVILDGLNPHTPTDQKVNIARTILDASFLKYDLETITTDLKSTALNPNEYTMPGYILNLKEPQKFLMAENRSLMIPAVSKRWKLNCDTADLKPFAANRQFRLSAITRTETSYPATSPTSPHSVSSAESRSATLE